MNDRRLRCELQNVALRYRKLLLRTAMAALWLSLAVAGLAGLVWARGGGYAVPGLLLVVLIALPFLLVPALLRWMRLAKDPLWVARRIERKFPDLDARLLAALEQKSEDPARRLGFLQETVIGEALEHARRHDWQSLVPRRSLALARMAQWATLLAFAAVLTALVIDTRRNPGAAGWLRGGVAQRGEPFDIRVEPEDTEVERGTGLVVIARFGRELPSDVRLVYRETSPQGGEEQARQVPMSKSLDDPVFATRLPSVDRDLTYAVRYGEQQTRWFKVGAFDYPDLQRADAKLKYPQYTGLPEKVVEDTRSVTAVEGTKATLTFRLNKPVKDARLVDRQKPAGPGQPAGGASSPVELSVDPKDPTVYSVALDLRQSRTFRLHLLDEKGRANKEPTELAVNVTANRPPELKLQFPARDTDVSPLEELSVKAQVWDDFGVKRVGMSYGIAGEPPKEFVLAEGVKGAEKRDVAQLLSLERLEAEPDQLLSYHLWAEDLGPDGNVRRTSGDMFFAEVRPFDQIYRQGEQPAGGQEQQQQQGSQNAQQAEELAELQKQIVNAIWKLVRRETAATPSDPFVADAKLVGESQDEARAKAGQLGARLQDPRSKAFLQSALKHMEATSAEMKKGADGPAAAPLPAALSSAQAAYQDLLKLRAREHQVVRGNRQQRQQSAGGSAAQRRQQQLDQLELNQEENRYETQRNAAPQQETAEQRETRQVMNRLRELAQRQEDLNRQMRELQSALEAEREEQKREEIRRQLARLRDQQQQQLRDADELRDRMDRPENQQRMADARQQLEETRNDLRRASEALEQGQVPQASASGARAGERLEKLREDFRNTASGQFNEQMDRMRQEARALDQKQQELSKQLAELDGQQQRTLRDGGERQQLAQGLGDQKQQLDKLLQEMKKTVEESEASEPLLSRKLYDAIREQHQQQTEEAMDLSRKLLDAGFLNEARQAEAQAGKGVTRLRQGVEQAAESVLGDEAEALRRARNELDALAQELEREIARNRPDLARGPSTRPGRAGGAGTQPATAPSQDGEQLADARPSRLRDGQDPTSQPSPNGRRGQGDPQTRPAAGEGEQPAAGERGPRERTEVADARSGRQQGGQQPGEQPGQRQGQRPGQGQKPGQGQQPGEGQQPGQGQQPGEQQGQQPGQQGGQGQEGQQPGEQQPGGQRTADGRGVGGLRQGGDQQQPGEGQQEGDGQRQGAGGDLRQFLAGGERNGNEAYTGGSGPNGNEGPLTGGNFREWSDRLRDVEEMVSDPRLRAEAARIRDRARSMRAEFTRHSKQPNWDLVSNTIGEPLVELRDAVSQELLRRESAEALVPIDREPVPPEYAEQVRRYYERLGSGRQ